MLASSQAPQFLYLNAAMSGLVIGDLLLERGERERGKRERDSEMEREMGEEF